MLDASWSEPERRDQAARMAAAVSSEVIAFRCSVAPAVAAARVAARASVGSDASDATGDVARTLDARFVDWSGASVVDTTSPPEVVASSVLAALRASGADSS